MTFSTFSISANPVDLQGHGALILGRDHVSLVLDLTSGVACVEAAILPQKPVVRPGQADSVRAHELQGGGDAMGSPLLKIL